MSSEHQHLTSPDLDSDAMQRFTATGRPFNPPTKSDKHGWAMNSVAQGEHILSGPANLLPQRYTDDSLISVPVMRPEDIDKPAESTKPKKSLFSSRRKSENTNFVIKKIPRGEYLKHYAKDEGNKYVGTEEPARDCILRGEDVEKYRKGGIEYKHEVGRSGGKEERDDGVVR